MTTREIIERLEYSARRHIGVSCVEIIKENRVEVIGSLHFGFVRLSYKKNGVSVRRSHLLCL
jgi:hypothetical protein